jgi:dihydroorotase
LRLQKGPFGFVDPDGGRLDGSGRLLCEMTVRDGKVVYDLNGMTAERWDTRPPNRPASDSRWDATRTR